MEQVQKQKYLLFDLETSGLNPKKNALLEFGCIVFGQDLEKTFEKSLLIKPFKGYEATESAMKTNNIDLSQCEKEGCSEGSLVGLLIKIFETIKTKYKLSPVLVGHNISTFDIPFLSEVFNRDGKDLHSYAPTYIDTLPLARIKCKEAVSYSLSNLCTMLGLPYVNGHRALSDCLSNFELVKYLFSKNDTDSKTLKYPL